MALERKGKKSDSGVGDKITIELYADGTTNLTRRLWMRISDKLTLLFPRTAYGILNEGGWRDIDNEAPKPPKRPLGLRTGYTPVKSHEEVESGGGTGDTQTPAKNKAKKKLQKSSRKQKITMLKLQDQGMEKSYATA